MTKHDNANHSSVKPQTVAVDNMINHDMNHCSVKARTVVVDNATNYSMNHSSVKPQTVVVDNMTNDNDMNNCSVKPQTSCGQYDQLKQHESILKYKMATVT